MVDTNFATGADHWVLGQRGPASSGIDQGRYILSTAKDYTQGFGYTTASKSKFDSGEIRATFRIVGPGRVGVVARWDGSDAYWQHMYFFYITNAGEFGCAKGVNHKGTDLVKRQHSRAIVPYGDNTLQLLIDGDMLTFWINQQQVFSIRDLQPLPAGTWGISVISDKGNGMVQGEFSRIALYH